MRQELRGSGVEVSCVMPTVVNTELTAGVGQRLVRPVEAEDVANEIVDALEIPRFDVWVPRANGAIFKFVGLLPRGLREAIGRLMKIDKLMTEVDHGARHAYEERAATSKSDEGSEASEQPSPSAKRRSDLTDLWCGQGGAMMGRIYDATWGRAFAAVYDRGLKATEEAGHARDPARGARRGERADDRHRRRHRGQPSSSTRQRSTELVLAEPDEHMLKQASSETAEAGEAHVTESSRRRPNGCPSRTTASTPRSSPWCSARFPTQRPPSPRRRGC